MRWFVLLAISTFVLLASAIPIENSGASKNEEKTKNRFNISQSLSESRPPRQQQQTTLTKHQQKQQKSQQQRPQRRSKQLQRSLQQQQPPRQLGEEKLRQLSKQRIGPFKAEENSAIEQRGNQTERQKAPKTAKKPTKPMIKKDPKKKLEPSYNESRGKQVTKAVSPISKDTPRTAPDAKKISRNLGAKPNTVSNKDRQSPLPSPTTPSGNAVTTPSKNTHANLVKLLKGVKKGNASDAIRSPAITKLTRKIRTSDSQARVNDSSRQISSNNTPSSNTTNNSSSRGLTASSVEKVSSSAQTVMKATKSKGVAAPLATTRRVSGSTTTATTTKLPSTTRRTATGKNIRRLNSETPSDDEDAEVGGGVGEEVDVKNIPGTDNGESKAVVGIVGITNITSENTKAEMGVASQKEEEEQQQPPVLEPLETVEESRAVPEVSKLETHRTDNATAVGETKQKSLTLTKENDKSDGKMESKEEDKREINKIVDLDEPAKEKLAEAKSAVEGNAPPEQKVSEQKNTNIEVRDVKKQAGGAVVAPPAKAGDAALKAKQPDEGADVAPAAESDVIAPPEKKQDRAAAEPLVAVQGSAKEQNNNAADAVADAEKKQNVDQEKGEGQQQQNVVTTPKIQDRVPLIGEVEKNLKVTEEVLIAPAKEENGEVSENKGETNKEKEDYDKEDNDKEDNNKEDNDKEDVTESKTEKEKTKVEDLSEAETVGDVVNPKSDIFFNPQPPQVPGGPDHLHPEDDDEEGSSHFMTYFVSISIITIIVYVTYHNRKKVLGLILEGRGAARARRSRVSYSKLRVEPVAEDVSSGRTDPVRDFIY